MSLTVLTDTYITLTAARAYASQQGFTLPAVDADAEALLKRSAVSLDRIYEGRYLGTRKTSSQPMAWLRNIYITRQPSDEGETNWVTDDSYGNPRDFSLLQPELGWAQTELTRLIAAGVNIFVQPSAGIKRITNRVETLEETIEYTGGIGYVADPVYTITQILRPLLRNSSGSVAITRGA